jgi:hypothetical protein
VIPHVTTQLDAVGLGVNVKRHTAFVWSPNFDGLTARTAESRELALLGSTAGFAKPEVRVCSASLERLEAARSLAKTK